VIGTRNAKDAIFTPTAAALWLVTFLGYAHQGLLQPIIPLYLKNLGHSELLIGFALAAFSATSFSLRPLIGYFTDDWSVVGVLALGVLILGLGAAGLLVPVLWVIFVTNAVRGIGWAALNTAGATLLAHIAPPARRAEAAGYLNMFQSASTAISGPLALWLVGLARLSAASFNVVFAVAAGTGLLAAAVARGIASPPIAARARPRPVHSRLRALSGMLDRDVALPMFLQACLILSYPALISFVVLYAQRLGLSQTSVIWYFLANGLTAVGTRLALGRVQDRIDRGLSTAIGFAIVMAAIVVMLSATTEVQLVAAGACYAAGYSLAGAGLTALAIDMANPLRRGAAMATYSMANQLGSGIGAALSGAIIQAAGYRAMYLTVLVPPAVALGTLWFARRRIAAAG
jgi:MFS family permease